MSLQTEMLELIKLYNNTDRAVIKANLKRLMIDYKIEPKDIILLGYKPNHVYSWTNQTSNNIPMYDQALTIAVKHNFDIENFWKNI